jgi:hypothetical protein
MAGTFDSFLLFYNEEPTSIFNRYMVLASLIHFGDKLRCGIEMVGISNFVTFLESTQGHYDVCLFAYYCV